MADWKTDLPRNSATRYRNDEGILGGAINLAGDVIGVSNNNTVVKIRNIEKNANRNLVTSSIGQIQESFGDSRFQRVTKFHGFSLPVANATVRVTFFPIPASTQTQYIKITMIGNDPAGAPVNSGSYFREVQCYVKSTAPGVFTIINQTVVQSFADGTLAAMALDLGTGLFEMVGNSDLDFKVQKPFDGPIDFTYYGTIVRM